jgi:hypothetical protein
MSNPFDSLQGAMFNTVTGTMGYDATWLPSSGGEQQMAKVLYNGPTEKEKLFDANYDPDKRMLEYKDGSFPGLFELVRTNDILEEITIVDIGTFYVKSVKKKWDGKTYEAQIEYKP